MNIIFLGSTGVHQSLLAASVYINPQSSHSCKKLPYFNDFQQDAGGHPIYIGRDHAGRRIHSLGVGSDVKMVSRTIDQLRIILDSSAEELKLVPIMIRSQRLISWLHHLARLSWLKPLSSYLIAGILNREYDNIRRQIPGFTNPGQSCQS
ncbi:MAG TPA: DUF3189 family protein [Syntrophomonas sp.]|nr:DUF3189 family protein [Syntrophomonas sp.]